MSAEIKAGITGLSAEDAETLKTAIEVTSTASDDVWKLLKPIYPDLPKIASSYQIPKVWRGHIEAAVTGQYKKQCASIYGAIVTFQSASKDLYNTLQAISEGREIPEEKS